MLLHLPARKAEAEGLRKLQEERLHGCSTLEEMNCGPAREVGSRFSRRCTPRQQGSKQVQLRGFPPSPRDIARVYRISDILLAILPAGSCGSDAGGVLIEPAHLVSKCFWHHNQCSSHLTIKTPGSKRSLSTAFAGLHREAHGLRAACCCNLKRAHGKAAVEAFVFQRCSTCASQ